MNRIIKIQFLFRKKRLLDMSCRMALKEWLCRYKHYELYKPGADG